MNDYNEFVSSYQGNWQRFQSFFWDTQHKLKFPEKYSHWIFETRDSNVLERANAIVIRRELQKLDPEHLVEEQPTFWEESHSHFLVGYVSVLVFAPTDLEGNPTQVGELVFRLIQELEDYIILCEDTYSTALEDSKLELITSELKYLYPDLEDPGLFASSILDWLDNNEPEDYELHSEYIPSDLVVLAYESIQP